ncbi:MULTISPECIES: dihydrofolate reductase family protein [Enterococcus]|uniref:Dihydrofolate reductase n=1 Tax=Enterococcus thailandicus TaxID=417368 RepID=A0A179ERH0_ENTTH|nr:dihydrofolate reductase family protein [Enterococcus thailandicus]ASZ07051.1 dihydrofolate reductase [Enterococcus thailandicus]MDT2751188.1 dihydrofolate reductase family protein [Enterococcus thailandicus]MDT2775485.1 dihydrofolate reductase family protein [Enterococcus thailandicus]MDT2794349.1 dihydrofolate reductase family protein [Enterococcus thailandicus]OAQ55479.1 dihydrofolate reductase [Enterococcus thailandicus]
MRKIVFYGAISLDGYLATKEDDLQWLFDTPAGEETTYEAFYETIDTTIMGRKTYEEAKKSLGTELLYPEKKNYVFSRNRSLILPDATVINDDPASFVENLRQESGSDIWIVGGGSLLKPLLEKQLIDEWWIQITPVLLGEGIRLFEPGDYEERLEYVGAQQFGQFLELHYRKK